MQAMPAYSDDYVLNAYIQYVSMHAPIRSCNNNMHLYSWNVHFYIINLQSFDKEGNKISF